MTNTTTKVRWGIVLAVVLLTAIIGARWYYEFSWLLAASFTILMVVLAVCGQSFTRWWRSGAFYFGAIIGAYWLFSTYKFNGKASLKFILGSLLLWVAYTIIFSRLIQRLVHLHWQARPNVNLTLFFWVSFAIMTVVWGTYWLAFYPGLMSNDSFNQWAQGSGYGVISTWHPLIHTFLIGLSSKLFNSPAPLLLLQVIFGASTVAYILTQLVKRGLPVWIGGLITLGYAIYPVNGTYMTTLWKDVPYMIFLLLLLYLMSEVVRTKGENLKNWHTAIGFTLTLVATALFRKNGLYVVIIAVVVLVLVYRTRRILMIALASFIMIFGFNAYTNNVLHATQSPTTEALGIPIQQVASVYANDGNFTKAQRKYFDQILPASIWKSNYHLLNDDYLKYNPHYNGNPINNHPKTFLKQWFNLFWTNKKLYVRAYLDHTSPLWKLNLKEANIVTVFADLQVQGTRQNITKLYQNDPKQAMVQLKAQYTSYRIARKQADQSVISFKTYKTRVLYANKNLTDESKLPFIQKKLIALNNKIIAVWQRYIVRGAWITLLALIALAVAMVRLSYKQWTLLLLVPFLNYASLFATIPASDFRYAYSLGFSVIIMLMMVLTRNPENRHELRNR